MWRAFRSLTNSISSQQFSGPHYRLVSTSASTKDKDITDFTLNSSPQSDLISDPNNETDLELNSHVNNRFSDPLIKKQLAEVRNSFIENQTENPHVKSLSSKTKLGENRKKSKAHSGPIRVSNVFLASDAELLNSSLKSGESSHRKRIEEDSVSEKSSNTEEFGTLAGAPQHESYVGDHVEVKTETPEIPNYFARKEINYYSYKMKDLIHQGKLQEAIDVIEKEMPSVRAWPDLYCYRTIIRGCATVGDTKKAFNFYNQLKKRGLKPKPRIWAQLFVACGHSHSQQDGLSRATKLRKQLTETGAPLTDEVYHTMIRAFGRCGDVDTAFAVMDDMLANHLAVTTTAFNSLLHACLFDKQAGFRHAVMVWRRMRLMRCRPDLYSYNLMVRCTQCGAGDPALLPELLRVATEQPEEARMRRKLQLLRDKEEKQQIAALQDDTGQQQGPLITVERINDKIVVEGKMAAEDTQRRDTVRRQYFSSAGPGTPATVSQIDDKRDLSAAPEAPSGVMAVEPLMPPNILAFHPSQGTVFELKELTTPSDRLAVVGGSIGVLQQMELDHVQPDIKTFSLLLASLPYSLESEEALLRSMSTVGVEPDVTFCNLLIRRRVFRKDEDCYKMALSLLSQYRFLPNIMTYGCLALACRTLPDARDFLADMDRAGLTPNLAIMKSLLGCALRADRYFYALEMLRATHQYQLQPDEQMLEELEERGRVGAKQAIRKLELQREGGGKLSTSDRAHLQSCHTFLLEYRQWLQNSSVRRKEMPWAYRSETPPVERSIPS